MSEFQQNDGSVTTAATPHPAPADDVEAAYERFKGRLEAGLAGYSPEWLFKQGYYEALSAKPDQPAVDEGLSTNARLCILQGLKNFCLSEPDFDMSFDMLAAATDHIMAMPFLTALSSNADAVRQATIEECAKVADSFEQDGLKRLASADTANSQRNYAAASVAAEEIAQAIRALGQKETGDGQ